jgi:hypothetical protein
MSLSPAVQMLARQFEAVLEHSQRRFHLSRRATVLELIPFQTLHNASEMGYTPLAFLDMALGASEGVLAIQFS